MARKSDTNSATKRRILATVLALAAANGHGDGATYADCVACGHAAIVGAGARDGNRFELGHVVSDCNGGDYAVSNLLPLCRSCNDAMGETDMRDVLTPRYEIVTGWNGRLLPDPGTSHSVVNRTHLWLAPASK